MQKHVDCAFSKLRQHGGKRFFLRMLRRFVSFLAALEASADPSSARSMALVFTGWLTRQLLGVLVLTSLGGMYTMSAQAQWADVPRRDASGDFLTARE